MVAPKGKVVYMPTTDRAVPVIEIFGPTVQGEGSLVGTPVHFVRFGGCDYRCSWCDTPFAVLPEEVRANAQKLKPSQIVASLKTLPGYPSWVVLSGGNPALHDLTELCGMLHNAGYKVTVETQGSIVRPWLTRIDLLTVSPKPPSSGMKTNWTQLDTMMDLPSVPKDLKVVIFDQADMDYAKEVHNRYPKVPMYLSMGTDVGKSTRDDLLDKMVDVIAKGLADPDLAGVRYGLQLHVLLWGHKRGV